MITITDVGATGYKEDMSDSNRPPADAGKPSPAKAVGPASDAFHSPIRDRRIVHYRRCLELLEDRLADSPLVAQFRDELGRDATADKQLVA